MLPSILGLAGAVVTLLATTSIERPGVPIGRGSATSAIPDSVPGSEITCTDFRTRESVQVMAQRLGPSGAVLQDWGSAGNRLCVGVANDVPVVSVSDGAGGAVVVWIDQRSGDADLYAQRITAAGTLAAGWPEDGLVVCSARGDQSSVALASDGAGGAIAVWQDYRFQNSGDLFAQRISSAGQGVWTPDGIALCQRPGDQARPAVVSDGAGGALVIWQDGRNGEPDLYGAHLAASGQVTAGADSGLVVVQQSGAQRNPIAVSDGAGGAWLVWEDTRSGDPDLRATRLSATLQTMGGWPMLDGVSVVTAPASQHLPATCVDASGSLVVAWVDGQSDAGNIRAQRLAQGSSLQWPTAGVLVCGAPREQYSPAITADDSGGVIVAWEDARHGRADIFAQRLAPSGAASWTEAGVPVCIASGDQLSVALVRDGEGGALLTWSDAGASARASFARSRPSNFGPIPTFVDLKTAPGRVTLRWRSAAGDSRTLRLLRQVEGSDWVDLAGVQADAEGTLIADDQTIPAGAHASYRLGIPQPDGELVLLDEVSVEVPVPTPLTLRFARYEAAARGVRVSLALQTNQPATLELLDVQGRRVLSRAIGELGPGEHEVQLPAGRLAAGLYFVRLSQGRLNRHGRVVVIR